MAEDLDLETSGLLDGLEGNARAERAELISWLVERGVSVEQIRGNPAPMLLASRRVIGDDGQYVSARQAADKAGVDLGLFERTQRAMGLPRVDDPDAEVFLRADAEAAKFTRDFLDVGIDPDELVQITRLLGDGLSRAAEAMRYAALAAVLRKTLGQNWRVIHFLNYIAFWLITVHAIRIGTDFQGDVVQLVSILMALVVLAIFVQKRVAQRRRARR